MLSVKFYVLPGVPIWPKVPWQVEFRNKIDRVAFVGLNPTDAGSPLLLLLLLKYSTSITRQVSPMHY